MEKKIGEWWKFESEKSHVWSQIQKHSFHSKFTNPFENLMLTHDTVYLELYKCILPLHHNIKMAMQHPDLLVKESFFPFPNANLNLTNVLQLLSPLLLTRTSYCKLSADTWRVSSSAWITNWRISCQRTFTVTHQLQWRFTTLKEAVQITWHLNIIFGP